MKISKDKMYMTRDGRKVRIYATDGGGLYPVHGAYLRLDGWFCEVWTEYGDFLLSGPNSLDLIEVKPKRQSKPKKPTKKAVKR